MPVIVSPVQITLGILWFSVVMMPHLQIFHYFCDYLKGQQIASIFDM